MDRAHRFSWEAHNGQIPEEMCVLHKCDTPSCVNPDHLFLGTNDDNVADRVAKGRSAKGEQHGKAKLTDRQILEIRDMSGTLQEIGDYYGVHNSHISRIKNRIVRGYL